MASTKQGQGARKTGKFRPRFRSSEEWAALGVPVVNDEGELPRTSRETTLAFIDSEQTAEVDTARRDWQRRLEADGAQPWTIRTFTGSDCEYRSYIIPRKWVKRPYKANPAQEVEA